MNNSCSPSSPWHVNARIQGGSKRPETFLKAMGGLWAMLTRNTGSIRVDFAQPFSLSVSCIVHEASEVLLDAKNFLNNGFGRNGYSI